MLSLLPAELRRIGAEMARYPSEIVVSVLVLIILFYGFFVGAGYVAGAMPGFGERIDTLIVGYVVWTLVLGSLTSVSGDLDVDARAGVLQQVFMSSYGPLRVFVSRTIANMLITTAITVGVLVAILLLTGRRLSIPVTAVLPTVGILLGSFGIAFLVGSLTLWLKQVRQLINLGQFVLLFLVMTPFETLSESLRLARYVLPVVPGIGVLRDLLIRNELHWDSLSLAILNGAIYTLLGLVVFRSSISKVRRSGSLGWY